MLQYDLEFVLKFPSKMTGYIFLKKKKMLLVLLGYSKIEKFLILCIFINFIQQNSDSVINENNCPFAKIENHVGKNNICILAFIGLDICQNLKTRSIIIIEEGSCPS